MEIFTWELPTEIYYKVNKKFYLNKLNQTVQPSVCKEDCCTNYSVYTYTDKSLSMECQLQFISEKFCKPTSDCTFIYQGKKRHANETWHTFCQKLLLCYFLKTIRSTMHNVLLHASGNFLRSIFWMNNGQGTWHKMHQKPRQLEM